MTRTFKLMILPTLALVALATVFSVAASGQCPGGRCPRRGVVSYRVAPSRTYRAAAPAPAATVAPGVAPVYGVPVAGTAVASTGDFLAAVNAYRARHGRHALAYDAGLAAHAGRNTAVQASRRSLGHFVNPGVYQVAAMAPTPALALASWQASGAHAAILLNPQVRTIGYSFGGGFATANLR